MGSTWCRKGAAAARLRTAQAQLRHSKSPWGHWWRNQESPEGPLWAEARDEDTFRLLQPVLSWNHICGKSALSRTHGFQSGSMWDSRGYVSDIIMTAADIYEALTSAGSICGPHKLSFWGQTDLYHHFTERKTGAQRWNNFPRLRSDVARIQIWYSVKNIYWAATTCQALLYRLEMHQWTKQSLRSRTSTLEGEVFGQQWLTKHMEELSSSKKTAERSQEMEWDNGSYFRRDDQGRLLGGGDS